MGQLHRLQKLALAGNDLTELPKSMVECKNLELARLSANELQEMPNWLFQLPKLTWLAFSGNAFNRSSNYDGIKHSATVVDVALDDIVLAELIGEGASGHIYRARWKNQPKSLAGSSQDIAVKIFKGEVTSDGYPQDELGCCLTAGSHEKLIKVVAQLDQLDADKKLGLVMELISQDFFNLGLPPSLKTCTRDTFQQGSQFSFDQIIKIGLGVCDTLEHLHANGISHGDVYAHNTMINDQADVLLGDFGAATNLGSLPALQREAMEAIEVRALGCLLDDVLGQVNENTARGSQQGIKMLIEIVAECMQPELELRPKFLELTHRLKQLV
jgi:tRNA A-37 threonylcarbamoyl transferase component Bud32